MAAKKTETKKPTKKAAASDKKAEKSASKKSASKKSSGASKDTAAKGAAPLYSSVMVLHNEQHSKLKLATKTDYSFANGLSSILLTTSEFASAAGDYPIVFAEQDGGLLPFAVTGYQPGENLYVDDKGRWREDTYIPAFARRYPFIFSASGDGKQLSLCVDANSSLLSEKKGEALYEDGKPSSVANRALKFCKLYHDEVQFTREICAQIAEADILDNRSADITTPDGKKSAGTGFKMVNERKLREMDADKFIALRDSGALNSIYCHLLSMRVWKNLLA